MRILPFTALLLIAAAGCAFGATGDPVVDALVDKLLEKGVITAEDAAGLEEGLHGAREQRTPLPGLPFDLELRAQIRFDYGDLLVGADGEYETERDLFLRRVRLGIERKFKTLPFGKKLELNLTLDADRADQDFREGERYEAKNRVDLRYIYADWRIVDPLALKIGKHKLPFSRISLTSSARQLLIERPAATEAAKDALGDYNQAQIQLHGEFGKGAIRYYFAYGDGADTLEDLDSQADNIHRNNAWIGRLEIAPLGFTGTPGLVEGKRDDTGIGDESHLTFGINAGLQDEIRYTTPALAGATLETSLFGADLAARFRLGSLGTLTGQAEYLTFRHDFNYREDEKPEGYYLQAGYLLPATVLRGRLEPALRYERFDHDTLQAEGGTVEKTFTAGFNHYLSRHWIKWSYNFVHSRFGRGIAPAAHERSRHLHQVFLQFLY